MHDAGQINTQMLLFEMLSTATFLAKPGCFNEHMKYFFVVGVGVWQKNARKTITHPRPAAQKGLV